MKKERLVQVIESTITHSLGYYSLTPEQPLVEGSIAQFNRNSELVDRSVTALKHARILDSLCEDELRDIDCIVVDIRMEARRTLLECKQICKRLPVVALCDPDQQFSHDYPYGTHVSDLTTPAELGHSVFWQRVNRAVHSYEKPISVNDTNSPIYNVFRDIADQTSDWIFIKDLEHRFVVAGEHFAATAGLHIDQIIGHNDLQIGGSEKEVKGDAATGKPGFWAQDIAVTTSGRPSVEENPDWLLYSKTPRYLRTFRVPLKNPSGEVFALLVCSQDVTDQISNERLLNERTIMLEQVTAEKKRAETNWQIAEDAVAAKSRFLAATSHDLRQPLHAIGLFLDSLDKRVDGHEARHLVQQIKLSCNSLGALFNSCLDISRLDSGVIERKLEHFHASFFLESMNEEFRRQAIEKGLEYRLTVDSAILHSDEVLLSRILRNLLNNAIENTDEGYLSIECRKVGEKVELSVADSGRGIADEELQRIFDEFHQINTGDARLGHGSGLGLAIVKRLCDLLDISIELKSQPQQGARFTLSIPSGDLAELRADTIASPVPLQESILVLIVEDDQNIRHGMQVLLEAYGCSTLCAADAESAKRMLGADSEVPHVIIADYHLSNGATGTQAIRKIRAHLNRRIPALLVTGDTSSDSEREAADFDLPVLYKPVDPDDLLAAINSEVHRFCADTTRVK